MKDAVEYFQAVTSVGKRDNARKNLIRTLRNVNDSLLNQVPATTQIKELRFVKERKNK